MTEAEWDSVIAVHLKGHFAVAHHAAARWRAGVKETGDPAERRDRQHRERVGPLRQRGAVELRRGEGRHRVDDDRDGP